MATNVKELQQYFADMDAAEEADAAAAGLAPDELRRSRLEPEYVKENRRASRVATEEAARTGEAPKDVLYDTDRMAALEKAGTQRVPPSMQKPLERARSFSQPKGLESPGRELREPVDMPEVVPSLSMPSGVPAKPTDFASLQKFMSPGTLKAPEAQPIPVANASTRTDAPTAVASTLPLAGPQAPAGKPNSVGAPNLPAPSSEGAGGDEDLRRLYMGQLAAKAAAGIGNIVAGRQTDIGVGDVLGERMKQIEALRAKREERSMELAREDEQSSALVQQYKSLAAQGLVPELPALDRLPPKQASGLIKTYGSLPGLVQRTEKTKAEIPLVQEKVNDVKAGVSLKDAKTKDIPVSAQTRDALRRSQVDLNKARIDHMGARKEAESAPASTTGPLADPRLEQRRQDTFSKTTRAAQKLYTDPLIAVASLEKASGPLAQGETPAWWTVENLAKINSGVYLGLPPEATAFAKTYFPVINQLRHALYGSALSAGEQRAFADQIELGLKQGPQALAASIKALADAAKDKTQTQLGYDFGRNPDLAAQWLQSTHFNDKVKGTSLENTFAEYAKAPVAGGANSRQQKPQASEGYTPLWNKSQGKWQEIPNEKAEAAKASGRFEE